MKLDDLPLPPGAAWPSERLARYTPGGSTGAGAWQLEMERAQADAWLQATPRPAPRHVPHAAKPVVDHRFSAASAPVQAALLTPTTAARSHASSADAQLAQRASTEGALPTAACGSAGTAHPMSTAGSESSGDGPSGQEAEAPLVRPRVASSTGLRWGVNRADQAGEPEASVPPHTQGRTSTEACELPIRVHVEGDSNRSTVWLGVDADALAALPRTTVAIARWLARSGYGASTWICNGRELDVARLQADPSEEAPLLPDSSGHPPSAIESSTGEFS